MATKHFKVGTVVAVDLQDGAGYIVGTITQERYEYSAWTQDEQTVFTVKPADGQAMDEAFRLTLADLFRFGVELPTRVLVGDGQIGAAK